jgi:hypothetical protein
MRVGKICVSLAKFGRVWCQDSIVSRDPCSLAKSESDKMPRLDVVRKNDP